MKKIILLCFLIAYLTFAAFILGFLVFQKPQAVTTTPINISASCLPDARVTTSKWRTFTASVYPKFSVDYPEVLIPSTQSQFINVSFRTKTNPFSSAPLGIDISVYPISDWKLKDKTSGIKNYQCVGNPSTYATIFLGSKVYTVAVVGMALPDAERVINSIKPLD